MSFYDDLDRCMQNPEFRRSYEEQARQLNGAESATVPIRQRPIPDQLDYFSTKLAGLLDGAKLERETLITIGAAVVNIGALAAQLRKQEADRNAVEAQLAETSADSAQWQARAVTAERELAELRERIGESRQEWGVQHLLLGTEYVQGSENARYLCRTRNEEHPGYEWRLVKRLTGEWKVAEDD